MKKEPKIAVFVDCETGGLNWMTNPLIELGAVVVDMDKLEILKGSQHTFNEKIVPSFGVITPEAAKVNGYTKESWADAKPLLPVMQAFVSFVKRYDSRGTIMAGHNTPFDKGFIDHALYRSSLEYPFTDYHILDTYSVAFGAFGANGPGRPSMEVIASLVGVSPEPEVHRAINGARFAAQLYIGMMKAYPV